MIEQARIDEWIENPVTQELARIVDIDLKVTLEMQGPAAYHPGDPSKTQEMLASLVGYQGAMENLLDALKGDWSAFIEEEHEEQ